MKDSPNSYRAPNKSKKGIKVWDFLRLAVLMAVIAYTLVNSIGTYRTLNEQRIAIAFDSALGSQKFAEAADIYNKAPERLQPSLAELAEVAVDSAISTYSVRIFSGDAQGFKDLVAACDLNPTAAVRAGASKAYAEKTETIYTSNMEQLGYGEAAAEGIERVHNDLNDSVLMAQAEQLIAEDKLYEAREVLLGLSEGCSEECSTLFNEVNDTLINEVLDSARLLADKGAYLNALNVLASAEDFIREDSRYAILENECIANNTLSLIEWSGSVEVLAFHDLISFTDLAYANEANERRMDRNSCTPAEFSAILEQLYNNGYVLVSPDSLWTENEEGFHATAVKIPENKKPLILTFDVTLTGNGDGSGLADRYILKDGEVVTETLLEDGSYSYDENDFISILDAFLEANPDFSWDGTRGVLLLTGNTVLGNTPDASDAALTELVAYLKEEGWLFGSRSYSGAHIGTEYSAEAIQEDCNSWNSTIGAVVGEVTCYAWPFGESLSPGDGKMEILLSDGYRCFMGLGWKQAYNTVKGGCCLHLDRRMIDGYTLRKAAAELSVLFDVNTVIDPIRPAVPAWMN